MNAFLNQTVATTPEQTFLACESPAINPEQMAATLLARSRGLVSCLHLAAKHDVALEPFELATTLEQLMANFEMLHVVLEDVWHNVDEADNMISREEVLLNMITPAVVSK